MSRKVGFGENTAATVAPQKDIWARHLAEGEQIVWEGRPGFGIRPNAGTFKTLAVLAFGIGIFGMQLFAVVPTGTDMADLFNIPVIGGINARYLLGGAVAWALIWAAMQTTTTPFFRRYMLSNQRAFIAKTFPWNRITSYEITAFRPIEYDGKPHGSIVFATEFRRADNGKKREFPVGFMHISDAQRVYKQMVEIQRTRNRVSPG